MVRALTTVMDDLYQQAVDFYSERIVERPAWTFHDLWKTGYMWRGRLILQPLNIWGAGSMVRGKSKPAGKPAAKQQWSTTFVEISLAGVTWDDVDAAFATPEAVFEAATGVLESGYRLGFSYNGQNDAFICSVTCKDEDSPNHNKTFTAFASSWYEALQTALYKHIVIAKGEWSEKSSGDSRPAFG